jgi:hypothetical protein
MAQRGTIALVTFVIEIILLALLSVMLAGGFAVIAVTGNTDGHMAGYNAGLTMILMASVMATGAGALHWHRQHIADHSRIIQSVEGIRKEQEDMRRDIRTLMMIQTARANMSADQLAERRANGHRA